MSRLWIKYAQQNHLSIRMTQFLGGASSDHVMDIQVVMNNKTEDDGLYGLHSYGMGCFIPLDPNTDPFPDTVGGLLPGAPPEIIKLLEMLSKREGGVSPVESIGPGDEIDAAYERLMKLPELPGRGGTGYGRGGRGSTH